MNLKEMITSTPDPIDYIIDYLEQHYIKEYEEFEIKKCNDLEVIIESKRSDYSIIITEVTELRNKTVPSTIQIKGKITRKKCNAEITDYEQDKVELIEYLAGKNEFGK